MSTTTNTKDQAFLDDLASFHLEAQEISCAENLAYLVASMDAASTIVERDPEAFYTKEFVDCVLFHKHDLLEPTGNSFPRYLQFFFKSITSQQSLCDEERFQKALDTIFLSELMQNKLSFNRLQGAVEYVLRALEHIRAARIPINLSSVLSPAIFTVLQSSLENVVEVAIQGEYDRSTHRFKKESVVREKFPRFLLNHATFAQSVGPIGDVTPSTFIRNILELLGTLQGDNRNNNNACSLNLPLPLLFKIASVDSTLVAKNFCILFLNSYYHHSSESEKNYLLQEASDEEIKIFINDILFGCTSELRNAHVYTRSQVRLDETRPYDGHIGIIQKFFDITKQIIEHRQINLLTPECCLKDSDEQDEISQKQRKRYEVICGGLRDRLRGVSSYPSHAPTCDAIVRPMYTQMFMEIIINLKARNGEEYKKKCDVIYGSLSLEEDESENSTKRKRSSTTFAFETLFTPQTMVILLHRQLNQLSKCPKEVFHFSAETLIKGALFPFLTHFPSCRKDLVRVMFRTASKKEAKHHHLLFPHFQRPAVGMWYLNDVQRGFGEKLEETFVELGTDRLVGSPSTEFWAFLTFGLLCAPFQKEAVGAANNNNNNDDEKLFEFTEMLSFNTRARTPFSVLGNCKKTIGKSESLCSEFAELLEKEVEKDKAWFYSVVRSNREYFLREFEIIKSFASCPYSLRKMCDVLSSAASFSS